MIPIYITVNINSFDNIPLASINVSVSNATNYDKTTTSISPTNSILTIKYTPNIGEYPVFQ